MVVEPLLQCVEFFLNEGGPQILYEFTGAWVSSNQQIISVVLLLLWIRGIVKAGTCLPEDLDIVAPLYTETKPSALNRDIVDTLEEPMSWELLNWKMWREEFPGSRQCETVNGM